MKPDLVDILMLLGFASLFGGLYLVAGVGWALVVCGCLLLSLGFLGIWRRST